MLSLAFIYGINLRIKKLMWSFLGSPSSLFLTVPTHMFLWQWNFVLAFCFCRLCCPCLVGPCNTQHPSQWHLLHDHPTGLCPAMGPSHAGSQDSSLLGTSRGLYQGLLGDHLREVHSPLACPNLSVPPLICPPDMSMLFLQPCKVQGLNLPLSFV